ncbi:right-handed parallel beta-helix repeat-containing protein [Pseudonocardia acidicola]|uniref:Right handed beta helix domain-containing protein n=1 Tax=Pseudonocardia acidicola TaxID=2724939 RepID=A0ABX1SIS2_9PSEU|nr:right-handed parallel beta-helix repeat-containing protein [Pseudonocardia acidicola]NMI00277.1 hypothetical protein [Pseudonocardia acidicola]
MTPHRRIAARSTGTAVLAAVLLALAALSGCSTASAPGPSGPPGSAAVPAPPSGVPSTVENCTTTLTTVAAAQAALDAALPGEKLCLTGGQLSTAELTITRSGRPDAPVQVVSDGAVIRGITVRADNVVISGLATNAGSGITLTGTGLTARGNAVANATDDGILCKACTDSLIESNMVDRADGTGIRIQGDRVTVRANTVSGSVRIRSRDADGMRFFGTDLVFADNTIRDIKQIGYPQGQEPHTDCFQTFDDSSPRTYNVTISGNRCTNVDAQCLIGTVSNRNYVGAPPGALAIRFVNNVCNTGGAQSVYLESYPDVEIRSNAFTGGQLLRAVLAVNGSTRVTVAGNTVASGIPPVEVDDESRAGFVDSGNTSG